MFHICVLRLQSWLEKSDPIPANSLIELLILGKGTIQPPPVWMNKSRSFLLQCPFFISSTMPRNALPV
jgi:hypothetical protein